MTHTAGRRQVPVVLTDAQLRAAAEAHADGVTWSLLSLRYGLHQTRLKRRVEAWLKERKAA
jgi:hypothetical protein